MKRKACVQKSYTFSKLASKYDIRTC